MLRGIQGSSNGEFYCKAGGSKFTFATWQMWWEEAQRLSATHSLKGEHRGIDILHVAASLRPKASQFLTLDKNQKGLAETEGLIVPV